MLTESIFTALALLSIYLLCRRVVGRNAKWHEMVAIALLVSFATTIRFVGLDLIPITILALALGVKGSLPSRVLTVTAIGAVASLGLATVALRNAARGVPMFGERPDGGRSLLTVLGDGVASVGEFLFPMSPGRPLLMLMAGLVAILLLFRGTWVAIREQSRPGMILGAYMLIYWTSIIYSQLVTRIDRIDARLLMPVIIPMTILMFNGAREGVLRWSTSAQRRRTLMVIMAIVLVGALVSNVSSAVGLAISRGAHGYGYNKVAVKSSPFARHLVDLPPGGIASNDPPLAYWVTSRTISRAVPLSGQREDILARRLQALRDEVASGAIVHWVFFDHPADRLSAADLVSAGIELQPRGALAGGQLFESREG